MIPADLKDDVYRMPYSKGENALSFLDVLRLRIKNHLLKRWIDFIE